MKKTYMKSISWGCQTAHVSSILFQLSEKNTYMYLLSFDDLFNTAEDTNIYL